MSARPLGSSDTLNFFDGIYYYIFFLRIPSLIYIYGSQCDCGVAKKKCSHNQNIASTKKQHWLITYEKTLIHCGTDILNIVVVSVSCNTS